MDMHMRFGEISNKFYTTHHLENAHSVLRVAVERDHEGRDAGKYAAVERVVAMEASALVVLPRQLTLHRGCLELGVTAKFPIRAQSHEPQLNSELCCKKLVI